MSMFSKLKQIKDLREKAKKVQGLLSGEEVTASARGISITMDGMQKITRVELSDDMLGVDHKKDLEKSIAEAYNDAVKKLQTVVAKKMKESGDFNLPGLS